MYNSYEEYMQNVLGMNMPNTYMPDMGYFEPRMQERNLPDVDGLYPEIYGIVYPMVQKACSKSRSESVSASQIDSMVEEVYSSLVPGDDVLQGKDNGITPRNGDVKNPRAKEERRPNNNENTVLRDLIRILIIREIFRRRKKTTVCQDHLWEDHMEACRDLAVYLCHGGMPGPR